MDAGTVTREQAEAVLAAVKAKFAAYCTTYPLVRGKYDFDAEPVPEHESYLPQLAENWSWGGGEPAPFAVTWEAGPSEWALQDLGGTDIDVEMTAGLRDFVPGGVARHRAVKVPGGVHLEAVTSYVLGIYPAE